MHDHRKMINRQYIKKHQYYIITSHNVCYANFIFADIGGVFPLYRNIYKNTYYLIPDLNINTLNRYLLYLLIT